MSFGDRLKEKREEMGITQVQLAELLGVSKGAIGNYEAGINSPKATMLYKIFEALKCDANYLFQDEMKDIEPETQLSAEEQSLVTKYRKLDAHGKKVVNLILNEEHARYTEENKIIQFEFEKDTGKLAARNGRELSAEMKKKMIEALSKGS